LGEVENLGKRGGEAHKYLTEWPISEILQLVNTSDVERGWSPLSDRDVKLSER